MLNIRERELTSVTVPLGIPPCKTSSRPGKPVGKNCPLPSLLFVNSSKPCFEIMKNKIFFFLIALGF